MLPPNIAAHRATLPHLSSQLFITGLSPINFTYAFSNIPSHVQ